MRISLLACHRLPSGTPLSFSFETTVSQRNEVTYLGKRAGSARAAPTSLPRLPLRFLKEKVRRDHPDPNGASTHARQTFLQLSSRPALEKLQHLFRLLDRPGNAPLIVDRKDGLIPCDRDRLSTERYIESYARVGRAYPFAVPEYLVILTGWKLGS